MNCDQYLSMLATLPVEELPYLQAREHAAGCRHCDRITRVVLERERGMLTAFGEIDSSVPAEQTAASALASSRRRRVTFFLKMAVGIAMVATIIYMASRIMSGGVAF